MYRSWDTERDRQNFLSFWTIFCPSSTPCPPNDPENQNFLKHERNVNNEIEILSIYTYMCTINEDHMICGSWNIRCDRQIFVIFGHFLLFQPLDNLENQNFNSEIIWCLVAEIWNMTDITFCYSGPFFAHLPAYGPKKSKFWKNEKTAWRNYHSTQVHILQIHLQILSFYTCVP